MLKIFQVGKKNILMLKIYLACHEVLYKVFDLRFTKIDIQNIALFVMS